MRWLNRKSYLVGISIFFVVSNIFGMDQDKDETFQLLVNRSERFNDKVCKFPILTNRMVNIAENDLAKQKKIVSFAMDAVPLIPKFFFRLAQKFLKIKHEFGTEIEQKFYKDMSLSTFFDRLLQNRPLVFAGKWDHQVQLSGETNPTGGYKWLFEKIGTKEESDPLILSNYLSYDEMAISALIGISSPTFFINNGDKNKMPLKNSVDPLADQSVFSWLMDDLGLNVFTKL